MRTSPKSLGLLRKARQSVRIHDHGGVCLKDETTDRRGIALPHARTNARRVTAIEGLAHGTVEGQLHELWETDVLFAA